MNSPKLKPQTAQQAYERYEQGRAARRIGQVQDWLQAKQELKKDDSKGKAKSDSMVEPKHETKAEAEAKISPGLRPKVTK